MLGLTQGFILPFDDIILMGDEGRFGVAASVATPGVSLGAGWAGPHGAAASLAKTGFTTASGIESSHPPGENFGIGASVATPGVSYGYHIIAVALGRSRRRVPHH